MWIKGIFLGLGMFVVGCVVYIMAVMGSGGRNTATGLSVLSYLTIHNPYFWAALVSSLVIGCAIVVSWPR